MTTPRTRRATRAGDAPPDLAELAIARGGRVLGVSLPAAGGVSPIGEKPGRGVHVITIPGFRPALLNEFIGKHWAVGARLKARDAEALTAARLLHGVPVATGKRRVSVVVTDRFRRMPDADSILKSWLDGMTKAGLIVDDSGDFCEWSPPQFAKGPRGTVIEIEDVNREDENDAG